MFQSSQLCHLPNCQNWYVLLIPCSPKPSCVCYRGGKANVDFPNTAVKSVSSVMKCRIAEAFDKHEFSANEDIFHGGMHYVLRNFIGSCIEFVARMHSAH